MPDWRYRAGGGGALTLDARPRESGDTEDERGLRSGDLVHGILLRCVIGQCVRERDSPPD